jgi:hypothetical protein
MQDEGNTVRAGDYTFLYGKGNEYHQVAIGDFVNQGIVLAAERVKFVNDRMSYILLSRHWCIIVLNVHATTEEKSDDSKHSFFYGELE